MNALLICDDTDETAILSLVLQRVGLAPMPTADLDKAVSTWAAAAGRPGAPGRAPLARRRS